jgi:DNA polymerase-3 subunit alpha
VRDSYVHLHAHSCFSLLDGLARVDDLVSAAKEAKMPALALTDHGTMFAAIEFFQKAQEAAIKPIVGCEVYVADRPLEERPGPGSSNYHLVLLAENEAGYRNLIRLTTEAHLRGFYRKPRVDHALLEHHAEGLVCLSGCASSELAGRILSDDEAGAEELADWYRQVFPHRYYLELQFHNLEMQKKINDGVLRLRDRLALPVVATNDVHYVWQRQAHAHEVLLCIQTQTTMSDPKRMRMETQDFYLKSPEQMAALFAHVPEALSNTLLVAERCNLSIPFGRAQFPEVDIPEGRSAEEHLRGLCREGMEKRYAVMDERTERRLDYELDIIASAGFVDYFLLVHDVIHFARSHGIAVGPGRGSAAGSLAAYCLFLTNVEPMRNGLSFERFLNLERVSMPDFDLDFADDRRDEVIRYVTDKYGRERVAQIITFGTIGPRAGVRDVGRALGLPPADVDRVAKLVPFMCNRLAKAKDEVLELQQLYEHDASMHELLDTVEDLEGVARHASTHAAGMVIARDPLIEHVPLYKVPRSEQVTTQYAMSSIEQIGLLKMDFLGLRTLTILQRACAFIEQSTGTQLSLDDIPLDDPCIYDLLSAGETFGIFQVDGGGMRRAIQQVKPTEFKHLVALLALYRPGPMDYIEEFGARKNGLREVTYDHPALAEVLEETFGIVVYQEQVMQLAVLVAGYSAGEGDLLRRAMAKKKPAELAKHREQFITRARARGTDPDVAARLFGLIEPFAGYAFNKSHSAAYAVTTCQTAYLKAHYPREYLAGYLSAERDNAEKVGEAMAECRRLGISIRPPDANRSHVDFTLEEGGIRFGLGAIKHVGSAAVESMLAERETAGAFTGLDDFCARVDWGTINKRVVESLARCGALDSLGIERGRIVASLDRIVAFGAQLQRSAAGGQVSLFGEAEAPPAVLQLAVTEPATLEEKLAWEQEYLGIHVTPHPVADAEALIREAGALPVGSITAEHNNAPVAVGGLIRGIRSISTRDGRPMASFTVTDMQQSVEAVAFSRAYEQLSGKLSEGLIGIVTGKLDANDGRVRLLVDRLYTLEEARGQRLPSGRSGRTNGNGGANGSPPGIGKPANGDGHADAPFPSGRRLTVEVVRGESRLDDASRIEAIYALLLQYPGHDDVEILVRRGRKSQAIPLPYAKIRFCPELESELHKLVSAVCVRLAVPGGAT